MASYQKRDSGLWSVRFTYYEGISEHTKRLSGFATRREAKEAYEEYISTHIMQKKQKITPVEDFNDLVIAFLDAKKTEVKESSYRAYEMHIQRHILPYFANKKTRDIKPLDILEWQKSIQNLSFRYKQTLRGNLHSIFAFGVQFYGLSNPVDSVKCFRNTEPVKEMHVWSEDQFRQFIGAVDNPNYHALFRFLFASGCRIGEALALTPADIQGNRVRINKSLTIQTAHGFKITAPKNANSIRTIEMPSAVLDELRALPEGDYIFGKDAPIHPTTACRKLHEYSKRAGVPQIRIHDLRHSHASLLISRGVPITAVSKRLGHKNAQITLSIYAHALPEDATLITSKLSSI